ncbi:hypothetical protein [Arthrobacter sp. ISL-5]|uniref:hypothetical protein n=1 Tax=Arthrobacter sp. ISL-5 TaxID=2819111 RepID=UPI001BEBE28A|nr:hypothetical protein [Arthrobacter sp. ISL-5]MBT2551479.1 hypothetical protein [Arthrobacter sp. ISL-5]
MAASHRKAAPALLRRTGLLAGILAVLAGILGMHVLTGTHSMHSPAALTAGASGATVHTGAAAGHVHAAQGAAATSPTHVDSGKQVAASSSVEPCSCSDSCASTHTMTVSCTPSGKTGSLSVPLPGTAVFDVVSNARAPGALPASYSYLPGSPSPGELSISRT